MQRSLLGFFSAPASADIPANSSGKNVDNEKDKTETEITKDKTESDDKKSQKHAKNTHDHWFALFPWLETNDTKTLMFCKPCRDASLKNKFATSGAGNCQMSTLRKHNESREHQEGCRIQKLRHNKATQLLTGVVSDESSEDDSDDTEPAADSGAVKLFKVVYCAAKSNIPNDSVNDLLEMSRFTGNDIPFRDLSSTSVLQIQESIVDVLDRAMTEEMKQAACYGIIVDESCDVGVEKKLAIYIRYVNTESDVVNQFVSNVSVPDGTADTITREIVKKMKALGLNVAHILGLGSDGASVMMGRKTGVGTRLRSESPSLLHVHCLAHRVSLASSDAAKSFPYMQEIKSTILCVYNHFKYSAVRYNKLRDLQQVFEEPSLALKEPTQVRWLSMHSAIDTVTRSYQSIVGALSDEGERKKDAKVNGLYRKLTSYKFVAVMHFLCDILNVLRWLSLKLQEDNVYFGTVSAVMDTAIGKLESVKVNGGGVRFHEFQKELEVSENEKSASYKDVKLSGYGRAEVVKLMEKFVDGVQENLTERLEASSDTRDVLDALTNLLDPCQAKDLSVDEVDVHVKAVETQYCKGESPFIESGKLKGEWPVLKVLLAGTYRKMSAKGVCKAVIQRHKAELPMFARVCEAALCIPVTSVSCERGFSLQNKIKTKFRSSLSPRSLELLMKISVGPAKEKFPFVKAVQRWNRAKCRRYGALTKCKRARLN